MVTSSQIIFFRGNQRNARELKKPADTHHKIFYISTCSNLLNTLFKNGFDLNEALRMMNLSVLLLLACSLIGSTISAFVTPSGGSLIHHVVPSRQEFRTPTCGSAEVATRQTELAALLPPSKLSAVGIGIGKFYKASPLIAGFLTASTKACFADSIGY